MGYLNVRSLFPVVHDIIHLISVNKFDVLMLTETWLDDTITDGEICPPGFIIYR